MSLKHQNPTKEKPQQSRVRNARIVPKQTMGFSTPNLTQENPFKYRSFELRIRKGRALKICKLQTRKIFQKKKTSKSMSLNLQNLTKDKPSITPWNLAKEKTLKTYELTTPKSYKRKTPSKSVSLKPKSLLQHKELETPKSWKSVTLKRANLTQEKPFKSMNYKPQILQKTNPHTLQAWMPKKMSKKTPSKTMNLNTQYLTKRNTQNQWVWNSKILPKKPFQTYELKPLKLQPKKKQKICEPKSRCLTWAFNWGVDIHPQKTKRCQQGSRGQNLSGAVWATISKNIKTRLGEGPFHGGGPFGEWH